MGSVKRYCGALVKSLCILVAPAALLGLGSPAAAQDPPAGGDDIVVTGRVVGSDEVLDQARDVTAVASRRDPLARFEKEVCPGVAGLKPEFALPIVERMRFNVQRLGLNLVDGDDCEPNVLVVFVPGLDEVMRSMFANDDLERANFGTMSERERKLLKAETGPTRAWPITSLRSADGFAQVTNKVMEVREMGRINIGHREDIEVGVVLIDLNAIAGLNTQQLADYATMRALARTREPKRDGALETILELFSPAGADVPELTPFDVAYLKNLYSGAAAKSAGRKLSGLPGELRRGGQDR